MTKLFSIWDDKGNMVSGPLSIDNSLLLGIALPKPLGELAHEECVKGKVTRKFHGKATFWVRRDR